MNSQNERKGRPKWGLSIGGNHLILKLVGSGFKGYNRLLPVILFFKAVPPGERRRGGLCAARTPAATAAWIFELPYVPTETGQAQ